MYCTTCKIALSPIEVTDETGLCMRCELISLRAYREREIKQLKILIDGPVFNKYFKQEITKGCFLNFT